MGQFLPQGSTRRETGRPVEHPGRLRACLKGILCAQSPTRRAIVEQVAAAAAASSREHRFEIEARLLKQLMEDLPRQIEAAEQAARMVTEEDSV